MSEKVNNKFHISIIKGEQFDYEYITHNRVIKLYQDDNKIIIGKDDSITKEFQNELKHTFRKHTVEFQTLNQKEFDDLLRTIGKDRSVKNEKVIDNKREDLTKLASDAPVVNLVNEIILAAVDRKASDIHFEVFDNYFR